MRRIGTTLTIIAALFALSGCTSMLLGGDVAPPQKQSDDDERSSKPKR